MTADQFWGLYAKIEDIAKSIDGARKRAEEQAANLRAYANDLDDLRDRLERIGRELFPEND